VSDTTTVGVEDQVPGPDLREAHPDTDARLGGGGARQMESGLTVGPLHEAGAVEPARPAAATAVAGAQLRQCRVQGSQRNDVDLVGGPGRGAAGQGCSGRAADASEDTAGG